MELLRDFVVMLEIRPGVQLYSQTGMNSQDKQQTSVSWEMVTVVPFTPTKIFDGEGAEIESTAHSMMPYSVPCKTEIVPMSILRKLAK